MNVASAAPSFSALASPIAAAYGLDASVGDGGPALRGPVASGHHGEVWRLEAGGRSWAVKRALVAPDERDVRESVRFKEAARATGIPTPASLATAAGAVLCQVGGEVVRVDEWVDLDDPDPWLPPDDVGALLATLHRVPFRGAAGTDPWYEAPVGDARWADLRLALRRAAGHDPTSLDLVTAVDEVCAEWIELERLVAPAPALPHRLRTCHRDLWADNVRRGPGAQVWVIDWDDAGLADPAQELAVAMFEYGRGDPRRVAALVSAYRDAGGPGRIERVQDFTMLVAQLGHLLEVACTRWIAAHTAGHAGDQGRHVQEERLREFLDPPLDRALVRGMLDAAG